MILMVFWNKLIFVSWVPLFCFGYFKSWKHAWLLLLVMLQLMLLFVLVSGAFRVSVSYLSICKSFTRVERKRYNWSCIWWQSLTSHHACCMVGLWICLVKNMLWHDCLIITGLHLTFRYVQFISYFVIIADN